MMQHHRHNAMLLGQMPTALITLYAWLYWASAVLFVLMTGSVVTMGYLGFYDFASGFLLWVAGLFATAIVLAASWLLGVIVVGILGIVRRVRS